MAAIKLHPAWQELQLVYERRYERRKKWWGNQIASGKELDPVVTAELRGFWKGVQHVLNAPEAADNTLERELARRSRAQETEEIE